MIPTTDDVTHSLIPDVKTENRAEYLFAGPTQLSSLYLFDPDIQIRKVDPRFRVQLRTPISMLGGRNEVVVEASARLYTSRGILKSRWGKVRF
jgi:hypothetical protein